MLYPRDVSWRISALRWRMQDKKQEHDDCAAPQNAFFHQNTLFGELFLQSCKLYIGMAKKYPQ